MIAIASTTDDARLDDFARQCASAHIYHLSAWRRIIERSFGHAPVCLVSDDANGRVDGFLPMVHLKSLLFGEFMVSMPYVNYGGPCTDHGSTAAALTTAAARLAAERRVQHLEVRAIDLLQSELPSRVSKVSLRLALPESHGELWNQFGPKIRNHVRRAEKEGMTVEFGQGAALLRDFYAVFSTNMRDLGTPVYSRRFFEIILDEIPNNSMMGVVRLGPVPIAAAFLVGFGARLEIPWASSLRAYNHLSPNTLLYWNVLKYACEQGYAEFDFGRSSPDSGTYRFKVQWGARPLPLHWHYWTPSGQALPELNPSNPRYRFAVRAWQHLPVPLATLLGPMIVKGLP